MIQQGRKEIVVKSKAKYQIIHGRNIDLHPYALEHGEAIVRLRNQEKSRYNLNQKESSTIEGQNKWYDIYAQRDDDIYWCICNKAGDVIGTVRLYDIAMDGSRCEEGSLIIDEVYAMNSSYALETMILVFDFAFNILQISEIVNEIRADNKNMKSISKRIGFTFVKEYERNEAGFSLYMLKKDNYQRTVLMNILDNWKERV